MKTGRLWTDTSYTAPYMHAGQFLTLAEVIDFYNKGGGDNEFTRQYSGKTSILAPLNLTDDEQAALVVFLEQTSGEEISVSEPEPPTYQAMPDVAELTQASAKRIGLERYFDSLKNQSRR